MKSQKWKSDRERECRKTEKTQIGRERERERERENMKKKILRKESYSQMVIGW